MLKKLQTLLFVLRNGEIGELIKFLRRRFWSDEVSFLLSRDLTVPFNPPQSRISFKIRELQSSDFTDVIRERPRRLPILDMKVPTCYVAESEDGKLCFMQWLIGPSSNDVIRQIFGSLCPPLKSHEALLEFAFTFESARLKNVMPQATSEIAEKAADLGCRIALTFVREANVPALKAFKHAGFRMDSRHVIYWRLFFPFRVEMAKFAEDTLFPFERIRVSKDAKYSRPYMVR